MPDNNDTQELREVTRTWDCDMCNQTYSASGQYTDEELEASGVVAGDNYSNNVYDGTRAQNIEHHEVCNECVENECYISVYFDGNAQITCVDDDDLQQEDLCANYECDCCVECSGCGDRCSAEEGQCCSPEEEEYDDDEPSCRCTECLSLGSAAGRVVSYDADPLYYCKNYKGESVFGKTKKDHKRSLTLGVELEMVPKVHDDSSLIHNVHHAFTKKRTCSDGVIRTERHCLTKGDSSIQPYGYELVTVPASLRFHKELWEPFFDSCASGFRTEMDSVGMHVHIGRKGMSKLDQTKFALFINSPENRKLIKTIAERNWGQWAETNDNASWDALEQLGGKYRAVNVDHPNTLEVRIFSGKVTKENVYKNIEFVHAVARFVKHTPNTVLSTAAFVEFVYERLSTYPALGSFLMDKGYVINLTSCKTIKIPLSRAARYFTEYKEKTKSNVDIVKLSRELSDRSFLSKQQGRYGVIRKTILQRVHTLLSSRPRNRLGLYVKGSWLEATALKGRNHGDLAGLRSLIYSLQLPSRELYYELDKATDKSYNIAVGGDGDYYNIDISQLATGIADLSRHIRGEI